MASYLFYTVLFFFLVCATGESTIIVFFLGEAERRQLSTSAATAGFIWHPFLTTSTLAYHLLSWAISRMGSLLPTLTCPQTSTLGMREQAWIKWASGR